MRDVWLDPQELEKEYPPEDYELIPIITFENGSVDSALQKISKISVKLHKLNVNGDLVTVSGFSKITKTVIVRSKTRRKATMRAKYVKSYKDVKLPIAMFLAINKKELNSNEIDEIKNKIKNLIKDLIS